ncbi:hypothetical protein F4809DRAFT_650325 [Biscogniauxia mediterranea]|nr:hypothetical protein F4809DRAFT_650325 [Biscogniauxia mediterranea]
MSDYLEYFDFDAYAAEHPDPFDFSYLNEMPLIGPNGVDTTPTFLPPEQGGFGLPNDNAAPMEPAGIRNHETENPHTDSDGHDATLCMTAGLVMSPGLRECQVCRKPFQSPLELCAHARHELHATFVCDFPDCKAAFISNSSLDSHKSFPHGPGHQEVKWTPAYACIQCEESFPNKTRLERHGCSQNHQSFACSCGMKFTRISSLCRHIHVFNEDQKKLTCPFKKCPRNKNGFPRKDHLIQHLEGIHGCNEDGITRRLPDIQFPSRGAMACPVPDCPLDGGKGFFNLEYTVQRQRSPFRAFRTYRRHMKDIHEETPFPCTVPGCNKIGAKGYLSEKDFMKHLAGSHPEAPPYVSRAQVYACRRGCMKTFTDFYGYQFHEANGFCTERGSVPN